MISVICKYEIQHSHSQTYSDMLSEYSPNYLKLSPTQTLGPLNTTPKFLSGLGLEWIEREFPIKFYLLGPEETFLKAWWPRWYFG